MAVDEERFVAAARNSVGEKVERRMRRLRACSSAELGLVASGSATQSLWLGNRKVGSQVVGKDRNQLPGKGTVRKLAEEEHEEKEPATEPRRKYTDLESDVGERDEHVVCYAR